jgi:predicted AAA+ superfamily ATPase
MEAIGREDILRRIQGDNPWWNGSGSPSSIPEANNPRRVYFNSFKALAMDFSIRRAPILLGPRRVGKTFMLKQLVHEAMLEGVNARSILYASIDAPIYSGMRLEQFIELFPNGGREAKTNERKIVIFDEIQYLRHWELHLKDLVDTYENIKFIASGSAAAALRLKSNESGAGRFSEFMLPPLTFYEFMDFRGVDASLIVMPDEKTPVGRRYFRTRDINSLNMQFIDYLNFGGYPEAVTNPTIRANSDQFIRNDIIDKVLLKDLPSLYGIHEIQELNKLFSFLAYNAGNEASFENISQESGITKPTIKRYLEYLESAFLIMKITNVDDNCKTMKRERNFKIYLNNPSMRAALFAPVGPEDTDRVGHLAESAIFSQWQHAQGFRNLRYARWRNEGEVDIVYLLGGTQRPSWIGEIKWSDRIQNNKHNETKSLRVLLQNHKSITGGFITSRTITDEMIIEGRHITIIPSALYCYTVGRNITAKLDNLSSGGGETVHEESKPPRVEVGD